MSDAWGWLLVAHAGVTWFLAGLIWVVQVVHYPLFAAVGRDAFSAYEAAHVRRMTAVVAPAMLVEAATAGLAVLFAPAGAARLLAGVGLALLVGIWLCTALVQVPCHRRLEAGYDEASLARLVSTNWWRTAAWSARALLAGALVVLAR